MPCCRWATVVHSIVNISVYSRTKKLKSCPRRARETMRLGGRLDTRRGDPRGQVLLSKRRFSKAHHRYICHLKMPLEVDNYYGYLKDVPQPGPQTQPDVQSADKVVFMECGIPSAWERELESMDASSPKTLPIHDLQSLAAKMESHVAIGALFVKHMRGGPWGAKETVEDQLLPSFDAGGAGAWNGGKDRQSERQKHQNAPNYRESSGSEEEYDEPSGEEDQYYEL